MTQKNRAYRADPRFVIRTPALPFDTLERWSEGTLSPDASGEARALDYERTTAALTERLLALAREPAVREALFVASPSFESLVTELAGGAPSERARRCVPALCRYIARMVSRATPFGLFAACSLGRVSDRTALVIDDGAPLRRRTRIDMEYLCSVAVQLERDPAFRATAIVRPNDTLYRVAGGLRYVETRVTDTGHTHHLVQIEASEIVERAVASCRDGATIGAVAEALAARDRELSSETALDVVHELVDAQLLLTDLVPLVTGREPESDFVERLVTVPGPGAEIARVLESVRASLLDIDERSGADPAHYRAIEQELRAVPHARGVPRVFHVDAMRLAPDASLSNAVTNELLDAAELVHRIGGEVRDTRLEELADAFQRRFGDREVPLGEVLDPEHGIPFRRIAGGRSPLLRGLMQPSTRTPAPFGRREETLLRKLHQVWATGAEELVLTDDDVATLEERRTTPLPSAFSVIASIEARTAEDVAAGDYRIVFGEAVGPSGARLLGRFCDLDGAFEEHVREHLRREEALEPDLVFAEVVHRPEPRLGNIVRRPVLRNAEISLLARSVAPQRLTVSDLRVSLRNGRFALRSASLDREVVPRVTSALNVRSERTLDLHAFLGALMWQGVDGSASWSWGPFARAPFLPRVRYGRIVLARARWRIERAELAELRHATPKARFDRCRALRAKLRMPRFVALVEGDNSLLVDWENPLLVEAFVETAGKRDECELVEMAPAATGLVCSGAMGRYAHELVVSFVRTAVDERRAPVVPRQSAERASRASDSWCLVATLHGGPTSLESALLEDVGPFARDAVERALCRHWSFVRSADPGPYLTVRFFGERERLAKRLLPKLSLAFTSLERIWRVQLETTTVNGERYGGRKALRIVERLFHDESEAVLDLLAELGRPGSEQTPATAARWQLALRGVDDLLDDAGLTDDAKAELVGRLRERYLDASTDPMVLRHQLSARFREERARVDRALDRGASAARLPLAGFADLRRLSRRRRRSLLALRRLSDEGQLTRPFAGIVEDLVPAFLARLLHAPAPPPALAESVVVYDFLARAYLSKIARGRSANRTEG